MHILIVCAFYRPRIVLQFTHILPVIVKTLQLKPMKLYEIKNAVKRKNIKNTYISF